MNLRYAYLTVKIIIKMIVRRDKIAIIHAGTNLRILLIFYMTSFMKPMSAKKVNIKILKRYESALIFLIFN